MSSFNLHTNKNLCESVMQNGPPYKHKRSLDMESKICCGFFPAIKEKNRENQNAIEEISNYHVSE